jgi:clan AA aspartic protease
VTGFVDEQLRALLPVQVSASLDGNRTEILAWIDTAFNGGLAIPRNLAADLGLDEVSYVEAILADGTSVELPLFRCIIDWFGNRYETEVAASDGKFALLGTTLLADRDLHIDYKARKVELR